jgi:hypothetical protein
MQTQYGAKLPGAKAEKMTLSVQNSVDFPKRIALLEGENAISRGSTQL